MSGPSVVGGLPFKPTSVCCPTEWTTLMRFSRQLGIPPTHYSWNRRVASAFIWCRTMSRGSIPGNELLLAESTYRFGFHGVTAGRWLASKLRQDYGMDADHFDFGRDAGYAIDTAAPAKNRRGVCFYARPETPRRAYELGLAALDLFHSRHPEVPIHLFGQAVDDHRSLRSVTACSAPTELNALYNKCITQMVLSATNVSLVPHEMLASGCIPVVNDAEHNRVVLDNDRVTYAPATPFELAAAISTW